MSHEDEESRPVDPDRAAILARRQHFIALALSGLATTAACTSTADKGEPSTGTKAQQDSGKEAPPQPCLNVQPVDPDSTSGSQAQPHPCLKIIREEDRDEPAGGTTSETGGETGGETGDEPTPRPCLSKAPPKVCLKKAAPKPCLEVVPPEAD